MSGGDGSDFTLVVSRRHFHHVSTNNVQVFQFAQNAQSGVAAQAACHRCACAWRVSWIKAIDVKRDVNRIVAYGFVNAFYGFVDAVFIHPRREQHVHAHEIAVPCAYAHLCRGFRVD